MLNASWLVIRQRHLLAIAEWDLTMTKYGDSFAFGGCYIVNKERGKGYGRKIRKAIFARVKPPRSIGIISGLPRAEGMKKREGFHSQFYGVLILFDIPTTIAYLSVTSIRSPVKNQTH